MYSLPKYAKVGIPITTFEGKESLTPVLTHISWGDDLDGAIGVTKSHLVTDLFFRASFLNEPMPWKGQLLYLTNEANIIADQKVDDEVFKDAMYQFHRAAVEAENKDLEAGRQGIYTYA